MAWMVKRGGKKVPRNPVKVPGKIYYNPKTKTFYKARVSSIYGNGRKTVYKIQCERCKARGKPIHVKGKKAQYYPPTKCQMRPVRSLGKDRYGRYKRKCSPPGLSTQMQLARRREYDRAQTWKIGTRTNTRSKRVALARRKKVPTRYGYTKSTTWRSTKATRK